MDYYYDGYSDFGGFDYGYNYSHSSDFTMATVGVAFIFILLFFILIGLYLLRAFALYRVAKKLGVSNPWLAFIPVASNYLLGDLAGDAIPVGKKVMHKPALWMLLSPIIFSVLTLVPYIMLITTAATASNMGSRYIGNELIFSVFGLVFLFFALILVGTAALSVIQGIILFYIYKKYTDESLSLIHMLLSLTVPLYATIYLLILGSRYPKGYVPAPAPAEEPPYEGNAF